MQVEEITQILRESPSVRLIKSRSVDFFLSFVIEAFEGQAAIMQERLHMLLENRLDEQENTLVEDDSEMTRLVESNEQKAKRLIKDWTDKGFLTNYQNEEGEVIYEISSHTSKLIDWVVSLKKEDYIGTESKFKTLFSQLKELVEDGLVAKTIFPELPPRSEYAITPLGMTLIPIIDAMIGWGEKNAELFEKKFGK